MTHEYHRILTINSGSSSIKFSLYHMSRTETKTFAGQIESIGQTRSFFHVEDGNGKSLADHQADLRNHRVALQALLEWLKANDFDRDLDAVGHRVVHGGSKYTRPQVITRDLLTELRRLSPFAPEHLPRELDAIEAVRQFYPTVKQVACFDTAFHRNMPQVAQIYSLPAHLREEGVLRYGFHGLSYEYITEELASKVDLQGVRGRIIIAHLGHGSSMAAVNINRGIDTTMGFTPTGGLVMSTRSGDLDPGVILYLLEEKGMSISQVNEIVNRKAGLLGVSETSSDMKDLLAQENENPRAALAVELFCYQAKKFLGALAAILGGLDMLVFTGGIGENAPAVRWRICWGLEFMGIHLDTTRNEVNAAIISCDSSPVTVAVIKTSEELVIARHTHNLVRMEGNADGKWRA